MTAPRKDANESKALEAKEERRRELKAKQQQAAEQREAKARAVKALDNALIHLSWVGQLCMDAGNRQAPTFEYADTVGYFANLAIQDIGENIENAVRVLGIKQESTTFTDAPEGGEA